MNAVARQWGTVLGVIALVGAIAAPVVGISSTELSVGILVGVMVLWWLLECIPIAATALLPAAFASLLTLFTPSGEPIERMAILGNYGNPIVFLFLGGFLLSAAFQQTNLDAALTRRVVSSRIFRQSASRAVLGYMVVAAALSMWMSNAAVAAMMIPMAVSLAGTIEGEAAKRLRRVGVLGIAWASSLGGVATIVGTAPNGIAVAALSSAGYPPISFAEWLLWGLPLTVVLVPFSWWYLLRRDPLDGITLPVPDSGERLSTAQRRVLVIFLLTTVAWTVFPLLKSFGPVMIQPLASRLDEATVALLCGLALFAISDGSGQRLLSWKTAHRDVEWGTLLIFGGGLALSTLLVKTGISTWISLQVVAMLGTPHPVVLTSVLVLLITFLTEVTSNTATTSMMAPIVISIAVSLGADPVGCSIAVALAASMAFMLPVATPPNAVAFATGGVSTIEMASRGLPVNMVAWVVISAIYCLHFFL